MNEKLDMLSQNLAVIHRGLAMAIQNHDAESIRIQLAGLEAVARRLQKMANEG